MANDLAFEYRPVFLRFFSADGDRFPLAINTQHSDRPERNQVNSRQEFGSKCGKKLPVPSHQLNHDKGDNDIKHVLSWRKSSTAKQGKHKNLKCVGRHCQDQCGPKTPASREKVFLCREVGTHVLILAEPKTSCES